MKQRTFFDEEIARDNAIKRGIGPRDPNVQAADVPRLTGQNALILERLRQGPATCRDLNAIALKYTSRISDLRAEGYRIVCCRGPGGINSYTLEE